MSWRERLHRNEAAKHPIAVSADSADSPIASPIGTFGAIGIETYSEKTGARHAPSSLDRALATWGEAEEERAAIVEHDGNIPRAWAEGFARLDPDRPPATCRCGAGSALSTT